ncbi:MAG: RNA-binding transcriptional accessory protein, partial [Clostridia bacterium]|nr:RNA-binding transcriptional accessory protein [Clostridia bacterium]
MTDYSVKLGKEFGVRADHAANIINLIDEGNTIPFIARYRKEMTGSCDDQVLREFADRLKYLRNLDKRKEEIAAAITEQGKMTDEIALTLAKAETMTEAEDVYRPFKQKRKTRATVAAEKGLEPLADKIAEQTEFDLNAEAEKYVNAEKGVSSAEEAIAGASDIIAERVSDDAELRKILRKKLWDEGEVSCKLLEHENAKTYDMYADYSEKTDKIPSHRILAVNRGENEECLKVSLTCDAESFLSVIKSKYVKGDTPAAKIVGNACEDAYKRLIFPSIEREV